MAVTLPLEWLSGLGLDSLTREQAEHFLQTITPEVELRVGSVLSDGLSNEQLDEFNVLLEGGSKEAVQWAERIGAEEDLADFISKLEEEPGRDFDSEVAEWGRTQWLAVNRPDYSTVVKSVMREIRMEIREKAVEIASVYQH